MLSLCMRFGINRSVRSLFERFERTILLRVLTREPKERVEIPEREDFVPLYST